MLQELAAEQVRHRCDPAQFNCNSTEDLTPKEGIIGQDRALSALNFGLNILKQGFNIYVSGPSGTGRTTAIKSFLEAMAAKKEVPPDWCYVHNFKDSYCPRAFSRNTAFAYGTSSSKRSKHDTLTMQLHSRQRARLLLASHGQLRLAQVALEVAHAYPLTAALSRDQVLFPVGKRS